MCGANLVKHSLAALAVGMFALSAADRSWAAPVQSIAVAVKAAAPDQAIAVGYYYQDYAGAWLNGPVAVGFLGASAVTPFYVPSYYPPYAYFAPPVYYTPLPYYGPAVVYGRPLLAPDPYFPLLYPYVRTTGSSWRHGRYPYRGYRGYWSY